MKIIPLLEWGDWYSGGSKWRLNWATQCGDSIGRPKVAILFSGPKWRAFWASQFGNSGWRRNLTNLFSGFVKGKERVLFKKSKATEKKVNMHLLFCRPVILHHIDTVCLRLGVRYMSPMHPPVKVTLTHGNVCIIQINIFISPIFWDTFQSSTRPRA